MSKQVEQRDPTQWLNQQELYLPIAGNEDYMYSVKLPSSEDFFNLETAFDNHNIKTVEMV